MRKISFCFIPVFFLPVLVNAQSAGFIENKGQWNSKVKFSVNCGNSNIFLEQSGYKVALNDANDMEAIADLMSGHSRKTGNKNNQADEDKKIVLHSHAFEVSFGESAGYPDVVPGDETGETNNYFIGDDPSKWATGCRIFRSIIYKNIYPGIDIKYSIINNQFKYDFIVSPGADFKKIKLVFYGIDGLSRDNENLAIKTSLGNVFELKPYTYEENANGKIQVGAQFLVSGNEVRFNVENYNTSNKLIIDPVLLFATFSGSTVDNWGYASTYDAQGNFYLAGIVFGTGFPVSNGAYQTNFGGGSTDGTLSGYDIAILKLNSTGSDRLYGTYLGGNGNEEPHNLLVDKTGSLIVAGTTSSLNFPNTEVTYGPGGLKDIFIAKLNANGTILLAARKIGGSSDDGVNIRSKEIPGPLSITRNYGDDARSEVTIDGSNNIYFAACTQSSDFPFTQTSFQKTIGGKQDGIIIKLSSDLAAVLFSSFLGGNGDDAAFSVALNPANHHIYAVGSTTSTNLNTSGDDTGPLLFKTFRGGICDGYIAEISNDGSGLLNMRYMGTSGNDMLYEIAIDNSGNLFLMGTTTVAFPVVNAAFNDQLGGKQFITKINAALSQVIYSTNFGKGDSVPDIAPTAFGLDPCGNVYVAGWGGGLNVGEQYPNASTTGLTVTPDAIRSTTDGSDFYIFVLEKDAVRQLYGTFYGNLDPYPDVGDHTDGGNGRFDSTGIAYIPMCANCNMVGTFPTTPGVWAPSNLAVTGARCSMAAVKISFGFTSNCLLPVTLTDFFSTYNNHQSILKWKTLQEINSSFFEIEHSINAQKFSSIGRVNAAGNSSVITTYMYKHNDPETGTHYYRLKMTDKDGRFITSAIVSVLVNEGKIFYVYPNPAKSTITVSYPILEKPTTLILTTSNGTVLAKIPVDENTTKKEINVHTLTNGWYNIRLKILDKKYTVSFLKE